VGLSGTISDFWKHLESTRQGLDDDPGVRARQPTKDWGNHEEDHVDICRFRELAIAFAVAASMAPVSAQVPPPPEGEKILADADKGKT
jgi:hypothetical protein